jgi:hypothetical protein
MERKYRIPDHRLMQSSAIPSQMLQCGKDRRFLVTNAKEFRQIGASGKGKP